MDENDDNTFGYDEIYHDKFGNYRFTVLLKFDVKSPSDKIAFVSMKRDLRKHVGEYTGERLLLFRVLSIIKNGTDEILVPETRDIENREEQPTTPVNERLVGKIDLYANNDWRIDLSKPADPELGVGEVVMVPILGITMYKCACGNMHVHGERCPDDIASNTTTNKELTEMANEKLMQETKDAASSRSQDEHLWMQANGDAPEPENDFAEQMFAESNFAGRKPSIPKLAFIESDVELDKIPENAIPKDDVTPKNGDIDYQELCTCGHVRFNHYETGGTHQCALCSNCVEFTPVVPKMNESAVFNALDGNPWGYFTGDPATCVHEWKALILYCEKCGSFSPFKPGENQSKQSVDADEIINTEHCMDDVHEVMENNGVSIEHPVRSSCPMCGHELTARGTCINPDCSFEPSMSAASEAMIQADIDQARSDEEVQTSHPELIDDAAPESGCDHRWVQMPPAPHSFMSRIYWHCNKCHQDTYNNPFKQKEAPDASQKRKIPTGLGVTSYIGDDHGVPREYQKKR